MKVGDKVKIKNDVDIYPVIYLEEGEEGVITAIHQEGYEIVIDVEWDRKFEDLEYWENKVFFSATDGTEKPWFDFHCEVIKEG